MNPSHESLRADNNKKGCFIAQAKFEDRIFMLQGLGTLYVMELSIHSNTEIELVTDFQIISEQSNSL